MIKNELISYNHNTCYKGSTSIKQSYNTYKNKNKLLQKLIFKNISNKYILFFKIKLKLI